MNFWLWETPSKLLMTMNEDNAIRLIFAKQSLFWQADFSNENASMPAGKEGYDFTMDKSYRVAQPD